MNTIGNLDERRSMQMKKNIFCPKIHQRSLVFIIVSKFFWNGEIR